MTAEAPRGETDVNGRVPDSSAHLDALAAHGRQVASQISRLEGELVGIVREIDRLAEGQAGTTTRQYVAWQLGLTPSEAHRVCRLARLLEPLPLLSGELAAGRLSPDTVATLASVATPDNETRMIDTARVATGAQLQTLVRTLRQTVLAADPEEADRPPPADTCSYRLRNGRWQLRADLAPELGAQVEAGLRAEKEAAFADAGDSDGPLCTEPDVSNAQALVRMANSVLAGAVRRDGILPERFQILIQVDEHGAHAHGGGPLEPHTITELLCESWITVLVTRRGKPVTITSPTRLATPAQQRALLARDRTCRFPGCGRTQYLKAHHIRHRSDGGPTQLDNLCLLCQVHHTLIHQPGWRLDRNDDGTLRFITPTGDVLRPPSRPPPGRPPDPGPRRPVHRERLTAFATDVILHSWLN